MQSLRNVPALLSVCVFTSVTVLCSAALGSSASEQMAAKRQISLQFQEHMQRCEHLGDAAAQACERQAHGWAEVAKADLDARRKGPRQMRLALEGQAPAQQKNVLARCNALSGRVKERCAGGAARRAG